MHMVVKSQLSGDEAMDIFHPNYAVRKMFKKHSIEASAESAFSGRAILCPLVSRLSGSEVLVRVRGKCLEFRN